MTIAFTYLTQPPARYTFEMPQLKAWVEQWCRGQTLNLFGGKIRLKIDEEISNDIDTTMPTIHHMDAMQLVDSWTGPPFDTIVLDPPYNLRKAREKYNGRFIGSFTKIKDHLIPIMAERARVISLGYDTVGMSRRRGFHKIAIVVVCHGGDHNDTLGVVEERTNTNIWRFE